MRGRKSTRLLCTFLSEFAPRFYKTDASLCRLAHLLFPCDKTATFPPVVYRPSTEEKRCILSLPSVRRKCTPAYQGSTVKRCPEPRAHLAFLLRALFFLINRLSGACVASALLSPFDNEIYSISNRNVETIRTRHYRILRFAAAKRSATWLLKQLALFNDACNFSRGSNRVEG